MRKDSFAAGFWCALAVAAVILAIGLQRRTPPQTAIDQPPPIAPARLVTADPPPFAPHAPPAGQRVLIEREIAISYSGNANTHKFHRLSCRYAACANCTAQFATREDALASGFRPGGCCDP